MNNLLLIFVLMVPLQNLWAVEQRIVVGGKRFTEGYILSEIFSQLLESRGFKVKRKFGLGGTAVAFEALKSGEIHLYPEYSGTLNEVLKSENSNEQNWLLVLPSLGFNNTYAIGVRSSLAEELGIINLEDLSNHAEVNISVSHEFYKRPDGWMGLAKAYGLPQKPKQLDHGVAYEAIAQEEIDGLDIYSTDAKISKFKLRILKDTKNYFPEYEAIPILRREVPKRAVKILETLKNSIDEQEMIRLNSLVELEGKTYSQAAHDFLSKFGFVDKEGAPPPKEGIDYSYLRKKLFEHLFLVFISLFAATLFACPLGYWVFKNKSLSGPVIGFCSLLQTIPGLALIVLMIPLVGIGKKAALLALFLYCLLPIIRNTYAAFSGLAEDILDAARGIGLTPAQRFIQIELPLAMPVVLAGIRTAGVICIGTATLAGLVGGGGLGDPIITGLSLNDMNLVFQGAIPAVILAVLFEIGFGAIEKRFTVYRRGFR